MHEISFTKKGFIVWSICAFFFLYEFLLRTIFGSYQNALMHDLELTTFQFSLLSSTAFLVVYGFMQIPVGFIADNLGLKKTLLIGSSACALASLGFACVTHFPLALFFRLAMGFGASFGFLCLLLSIYQWMPHKYSAAFIGLSQLIGTLGPVIAAGPLETITHSYHLSWQYVFILLGCIGGVLTLLIGAFVENNISKAGKNKILYKPQKVLTVLSSLFARPQPLYIACFSACIYFAIEYLSENEGRNLLLLKGFGIEDASYMLTTSWVGYAIGCPLLGIISDYFQRRKIVMQYSGIVGVFAVAFIILSSSSFLAFSGFFLLGMSASGVSIGFAIVGEHFNKNTIAIGLGLNNAFIMTFASLSTSVFGVYFDLIKKGGQVTLGNYLVLLYSILAIICVAVIVAFFFVKETFCKSMVEYTYLCNDRKANR